MGGDDEEDAQTARALPTTIILILWNRGVRTSAATNQTPAISTSRKATSAMRTLVCRLSMRRRGATRGNSRQVPVGPQPDPA
jgi:hypothetical protein